jgi:microcystin-dependent protein
METNSSAAELAASIADKVISGVRTDIGNLMLQMFAPRMWVTRDDYARRYGLSYEEIRTREKNMPSAKMQLILDNVNAVLQAHGLKIKAVEDLDNVRGVGAQALKEIASDGGEAEDDDFTYEWPTDALHGLLDGDASKVSLIESLLSRIDELEESLPSRIRELEKSRIGEIFWWSKSSPPANSLFCNGAAISREEYADLFAIIGTAFGAGNGSATFNIPDLRGYFIRGYDPNNVRDPSGSGRGFGKGQAATQIPTMRSHRTSSSRYIIYPNSPTVDVTIYTDEHDGNTGAELYCRTSNMASISTTTYPTRHKVRPVNINLLPCIRAK